MIIVIVESPHKAKTITKYLGHDYKVVASVGHIRDLAIGNPKYPFGVNIENEFEPIYAINSDKKKTVSSLKSAVEKADDVYLATDPDREGEAISWHLANVLGLDVNKTKRLEFHEITYHAVTNALKNARTIDLNLVHSQETRRIIDRIMGFDLSQLMQSKIGSKSAGRVQSVVLKMIVDREREIEAFIETTYFTINGVLQIDGKKVNVNIVDDEGNTLKFDSEEKALDAIKVLLSQKINISDVHVENKTRLSRPVYTTSTLQQDASIHLNYDSKKTMKIAQSLYEGVELEKGKGPVGLITYMRTDSVRISPMFINSTKEYIETIHGQQYVGIAKVFNKNSDNIQDAHEGIRPTDINITPEMVEKSASKDEAKLYKMIYIRALASMMKEEIYEYTLVSFTCDKYKLQAIGEKTIFDGYTKEYKKIDKSERKPLAVKVTLDSKIDSSTFEHKSEKTKGPQRYSEARLISAMEKEGVGRPSTYASTIDLIRKRGYVNVARSIFTPTEQGKRTVDMLAKWFPTLINIKYTSEMETKLDLIAANKENELDTLTDFYSMFSTLLADAKKGIAEEPIDPSTIIDYGTCPQCGKNLVKRTSRYGAFIACSGYPECHYIKPDEKIGKECPKCHEGQLMIRSSKFGKFLACNRYPDCKYTEKQ